MKNKNLLIGLCSVPLLLSISTNMIAQDLRERTYYYEILEPRHEPKPEIKGLIAYASTAERHRGTIYLADRWFKVSETKSAYSSWESRPGRANHDLSRNFKFARNPSN